MTGNTIWEVDIPRPVVLRGKLASTLASSREQGDGGDGQPLCRHRRRLREVEASQIFQTAYASPQLEFWELDDTQWRKIGHRPYERRPVLLESSVRQLALSGIGSRKP